MASSNQNWYGHLVGQSRTNDIYTLIHTYLTPDWQPNHALDFVVVRRSQLPDRLKNIPPKHISKKLLAADYCFPGNGYVLLHNYQLTEYLHAARWAQLIEDFEGRGFIELRYDWTEEAEACWNDPPASRLGKPKNRTTPEPTPVQQRPPESAEEAALLFAYDLLQRATEKKQALEFAEVGKRFLDTQNVLVGENSVEALQLIERRMMGYNIVAMVYAWNDQINKAAAVDNLYMKHPLLWPKLRAYIEPYLELLLIKQQLDYLQQLFGDKAFRQQFLAHYEAFVAIFINPDYALTRMGEVVGIINRVNNDKRYR